MTYCRVVFPFSYNPCIPGKKIVSSVFVEWKDFQINCKSFIHPQIFFILVILHKNWFGSFSWFFYLLSSLKASFSCLTLLSESCSVVSDYLWPHGPYSPWNSPGQDTGVGSVSLLQSIFLTQELNQVLLHCSQIIYQLRHQGS